MTTRPVSAIIIGSGFAGLGAAIRLQQEGFDDLVILERNDSVAGTWRDNTYPGAACDVPSHLYSLSFEPKADWSHAFAYGSEIREYLEELTDRHDLRRKIVFGATVDHAEFDESRARWHVRTEDGRTFDADALICGVGALKDPRWPDIPGQDTFEGVAFHSAQWPADTDLSGKRVGVIGTGASAIQFIPEVAEQAGRLTVFQRNAPWVLPRPQREYGRIEQALHRFPPYRLAHRLSIFARQELLYFSFHGNPAIRKSVVGKAQRNLDDNVADPRLKAELAAEYEIGCKRVGVHSEYYQAFARNTVDLVTDPIAEITSAGVRLQTGEEVELDVLVYGTGFTTTRMVGEMDIVGLGGAKLREQWGLRPTAYLGITVPNFPNFFMLYGPNTNLGHNSVLVMIEGAIRYTIKALQHLAGRDLAYLDVRQEALDGFLQEVEDRHGDQVWLSGCTSWYLNEAGENFSLWPGLATEYLWRTRRFEPERYHEVRRHELPAEEAPRVR